MSAFERHVNKDFSLLAGVFFVLQSFVNVKQARKIPNKKYDKLTDSELELHIKKLRKIASALVDIVIDKHCKINSDYETSSNIS